MKAPSFIGDAIAALKSALSRLGPVVSSLAEKVASTIRSAGATAAVLASKLGKAAKVAVAETDAAADSYGAAKPRLSRQTVVIAVSALAIIASALAIAALAGGAKAGRVDAAATVPSRKPAVSTLSPYLPPSSGPGLAAALRIPEQGEWPWPLAFEPKSIYTDADAAALRPNLGEIDVTELTRRRKAALEATYGSVD